MAESAPVTLEYYNTTMMNVLPKKQAYVTQRQRAVMMILLDKKLGEDKWPPVYIVRESTLFGDDSDVFEQLTHGTAHHGKRLHYVEDWVVSPDPKVVTFDGNRLRRVICEMVECLTPYMLAGLTVPEDVVIVSAFFLDATE